LPPLPQKEQETTDLGEQLEMAEEISGKAADGETEN